MSKLSPVRRYPTETVTAASPPTVTATSATVIGVTRGTTPLSSIPPTWIALTTWFTPPISCFTDVYDDQGSLEIDITDDANCYPPGYSASSFFSPGFCPYGYNTQMVTLLVATSSGALNETIGTCCPMDYTLNSNSLACESGFNQPSTVSSHFVVQGASSTTTITVQVPETTTLNSTSTTTISTFYSSSTIHDVGPGVIVAPTLLVRWKENDKAVMALSSESSSLASSAASVSSASAASVAAANSTAKEPTSSTSLVSTSTPRAAATTSSKISGGAIAGIVVGILAAFVLAVGGFLLWRRKKNNGGSGLGRNGSRWRKSELEATSVARAELPGEKDIKELPRNETPAELQGSSPPIDPPPTAMGVQDHSNVAVKDGETNGVNDQQHTAVQNQLPTAGTIRSPMNVPTPHDLGG